MSFRLTQGGWVLLFLCALFAMGAYNADLNLIYLLTSLLMAVFVLALIAPFWNIRKLQGSRAIHQIPHAGEPFSVTLWLTNARKSQARFVTVEDSLPLCSNRSRKPVRKLAAVIEPGERTDLVCVLPPLSRGVYSLPGLRWSTRTPFGILECSVTSTLKKELIVYPARGQLNSGAVGALQPYGMRMEKPSHRGLEGVDFRLLREYRPGDNLRHIHWRSSARLGQLHVRQMEPEHAAPVMVVLDSRLPASLDPARKRVAVVALETAISFAAEFSRVALEHRAEVTLVGFFPEARAIRLLPGRAAIDKVNDALARLEPSQQETAEGLKHVVEQLGVTAGWRILAVSPLHETAETLRASMQGIPLEIHVAGDERFAHIFSMVHDTAMVAEGGQE